MPLRRAVSVREVMSEKVLVADPGTTVAEAAKLMAGRGVGSIVITQGGKPVGILTERDILMKVVSSDLRPSQVPVERIMSSPVITTEPKADVLEAARVMARNRIRHLPVVERGVLVGIVTARDIMGISPEISEMLVGRHEPPAEEIEQSVCEICGEMTGTLYEIDGVWICENCRDAMGR